MSEVFHVCASQGGNNCVELDLPASDYEMLDLMERLRLEPGQPPYLEILRYREEFDYLERCIHDQPDICQLNALARKLSAFSGVQDMAVFEGLVGKEIGEKSRFIPIPRLIDFACGTEGSPVAEGVMTDVQLGKFLVENEFVEEANSLPDAALALLDYGKIGREHREAGNGVYTGFGYVELHSEPQHVSEAMDFQPRKPAYTILLNMAAIPLTGPVRQEDMVQLRLPAPESQVHEALEKLGVESWKNVAASIWDSPIPRLNHTTYLDGEMPQILELAQRLSELDAQDGLPRYKAVLAAADCSEIGQALSLAGAVDAYIFDPAVSSPEDVAIGELCVMAGQECAADFAQYVDLPAFGRALLERDHAVITGYGLIERQDGQPILQEEQASGLREMEM